MAVKCEMCGSPDLVKDGEYFECKHCGCKYTVAEIKRQMGVVTVTVNQDDKKESLIRKAETEYASSEYSKALETYNKVLEIDPDDPLALYRSALSQAMSSRIVDYHLDSNIIPYFEQAKDSLKSGKYPNYPYDETVTAMSIELREHIVVLASYVHDNYKLNKTSLEANAILKITPIIIDLVNYLDDGYCLEFWPDRDAIETSLGLMIYEVMVLEDSTEKLYYADYVDQYGNPTNIEVFERSNEKKKTIKERVAIIKKEIERKEAQLKAVKFIEKYDGDLSAYYHDIKEKYNKVDQETNKLDENIKTQENIIDQNYGAIFGKKTKILNEARKEKEKLLKKKNEIAAQHTELEAFVQILEVKLGLAPSPKDVIEALENGASPDEALGLSRTATEEEYNGPKALLIDDVLVCQGCDFVMDNPDPDIKYCPQCGLEVVKG